MSSYDTATQIHYGVLLLGLALGVIAGALFGILIVLMQIARALESLREVDE